MNVRDVAAEIEKIASVRLALDWDNVGLLVGSGEKTVDTIVLTIDISADVLEEARFAKADLIISYHPVIWDGLKTVTAEGTGKIVYELIRSNISVYSIHTALDIATGGVNDSLAEIVGIENAKPIGDYVENPGADMYKLVVFLPFDAVDRVSKAVFKAGAGSIGAYRDCGFQAAGVGTFFPLEGARPAIGTKGRLEKVDEIRFETVVPAAKITDVIKAMRGSHPYEMPAFDLIKLCDVEKKYGLGRMGRLSRPKTLDEIMRELKKATGARTLGIVGKQKRTVKTAAVCAGSCGRLINIVIAEKCDLYVTGELKHHQALAASEGGTTCICLSHSVSERFILRKLARQLQKQLKGVKIIVSKKDSDPFNWKNI
ncbi:MAG: Nif3-like dinuclear metal center hexameric protein [Planctomycetota bacterium]